MSDQTDITRLLNLLAHGCAEPAASAAEPADGNNDHAACAGKPAARENEPAAHPHEPAARENEPAAHPHEPAARENEPAAHPHEPAARKNAADQLLPLVYDELRRLAASHLRQQRPDHTLQATALVHEAYLKLVDQTRVEWQSRAHFFAVAALAIRRLLVDHARARGCQKRGGGRQRLSFDAALTLSAEAPGTDLLALDEALERFARAHPDQARVVELRFFGGLTVPETAGVLGVTPRTVERRWEFSRAWLYRALEDADGRDGGAAGE